MKLEVKLALYSQVDLKTLKRLWGVNEWKNKNYCLAVGGLPVQSHPGCAEVSMIKTPKPQFLWISWLVPCMASNQFNSIQFNFICIALLTKELCHKAVLQRTGPLWVSLGQQWQGKTPWQMTGRKLEQNRTQRGTICCWLELDLIQLI